MGRAKIDYDKCVSCGMCLVNCPFGAIADKGQIFQLITVIEEGAPGDRPMWPPPSVASLARIVTPDKMKAAMNAMGFADVVEVAIGADLCTIEEAHDFCEQVPAAAAVYGHLLLPGLVGHGQEAVPRSSKDYISMALTPNGASQPDCVKKAHPDAQICLHRPLRRQKAGGQPPLGPHRRGLCAHL